jgi:UDP-N-acetylmuramate--alanine ligase
VIKDLDCKIVDYKELQDLDIKLKIPGVHNKENAMASISVSNFLNIETSSAIKSLSEFNGTWRRFDFKGVTKNGVFIYDDYAHHPKEIEMTIKGCREKYGNKKLVAIFEPHQFSRTKLLFDQFAESLDLADLVYLTPIYPARESFDPTINSEMLTDKIGQKASVLETKEDIVKKIEELKDCVVIFFGAGNIYKISEMLDLSV